MAKKKKNDEKKRIVENIAYEKNLAHFDLTCAERSNDFEEYVRIYNKYPYNRKTRIYCLRAMSTKFIDTEHSQIVADMAQKLIESSDWEEGLLISARIAFRFKEYNKVDEYLTRLIALSSPYVYNGEAILFLALSKIKTGKYKDAINLVEPYIGSMPRLKEVLAKVYTYTKQYDKAIKIWQQMIDYEDKETAYQELIGIKIHEKNYLEAYKYAKEMIKNAEEECSLRIYFYLCHMLGIIPEEQYLNKVPKDSYELDQLMDYSEADAIDHISDHHINESDYYRTRFAENIDICELMKEVRPYLTEKYFLCNSLVDCYIIPYPNAGINGENYIKVVTIPNTKVIVSMYPYHNMNQVQATEKRHALYCRKA